MITEIKKVEINEDEIILEGINLENIFTAEDLFQDTAMNIWMCLPIYLRMHRVSEFNMKRT